MVGSPSDFLVEQRDRLRVDPELLQRYDEAKMESAAGGRDADWEAKNRFHTDVLGH